MATNDAAFLSQTSTTLWQIIRFAIHYDFWFDSLVQVYELLNIWMHDKAFTCHVRSLCISGLARDKNKLILTWVDKWQLYNVWLVAKVCSRLMLLTRALIKISLVEIICKNLFESICSCYLVIVNLCVFFLISVHIYLYVHINIIYQLSRFLLFD